MKAHLPLTAKEEKIVRFAVKNYLDKHVEDIVLRAQCLVLASMLNVGLSAKTVNRVVADLPLAPPRNMASFGRTGLPIMS